MRINNLAEMFLVGILVPLPLYAQQSRLAQLAEASSSPVQNFGRLPLTFEANRGQAASEVKFLSRGHGYNAFLTSGGMTLSLRASDIEAGSNSARSSTSDLQPSPVVAVQFRLIGASQNPQVVGEDPQPGRVNYFMGKDPLKWRTNVPTYRRVRYRNVYPGIDLVYYGNYQQLEYDFALSPGADPRQIQFEIKGVTQMTLSHSGELVLQVKGAKLHFQSPVVYQESNGQRVPVVGGYVMKDPSHIGFQLSDFDSSKPLVIDPVLVYSTYLGGSGGDQPTGIEVDNSGNVYLTGYTDSADFPLTTLGSLATNNYHVFVVKLDATGSNLIYADYIGGDNADYSIGLVLDSANEVYVSGATQSTNFPVVNAFQSQQPGPYAGFLTRISADGCALLYSTYLGGNNSDQPSAIAIDGSGEVLVAGYTQSQNFPVINAFQPAALANQGGIYGTYGFLTKFSADDSSLLYSTYFAGNANVEESGCCWIPPFSAINAVAADANGNAYVAGTTNTYNFPVTTGSFLTSNTTVQNSAVGFVSKFNSAGGLDYSTYFYGSSGYPVSIASIAVDDLGSAYITGSAYSDGTFPITSTSICDPGSYGFACGYTFATKFSPGGSALTYSTFLGPNNYATPQAIALDTNQDAYVFAFSNSSSFAEVNGIQAYDSGYDALLVEINPDATAQTLATYIGGNHDDLPAGIALDNNGNIYVAGSTDSQDFPVTQGVFQNQRPGINNVFVAKIGPASAPSVSLSPGSLQFASQAVGSISSPQTVLLRNMGNAPLSITSITGNGDFAETDTCNGSVPSAGSCTISVTFSPTAQGARSGSIAVDDNAAGTPHTVTLYGVGEGGNPIPYAALMPSALTFLDVPVGRPSLPQSVTLTNAGNAFLSISSLQISGDFSETNTCTSSLAPGAVCTISIVFTPTAQGSRSGNLAISDNAQDNPQTVNLVGTGTAGNLVLNSNSLTFSNVQVGSSASQTVMLTNTGNGPVSINGLQITGDYSPLNNCPSPISAGAVCEITVVFTPTTTGTRAGTLTVTSGAQGIQQTVALSGTGTAATLALASSSLTFSNVLVSSSASQAVMLTNTGYGPVSMNGLQITGDYSLINNCSTSISAGVTCAVTVVFTPTTTGTRTGSLIISDSAQGSPQTVSLSGTGVQASLNATPTTLAFSYEPLGTSSASQVVTLTNTGNLSLSISNLQITGDYRQTNNCPATLSSSSRCMVNIIFTPSATGIRNGSLTITDSAGKPLALALSGSGVDFSLSTLTNDNTIQAGSSATYTITVSAIGGSFPDSVSLTCSGLPKQASCNFSPNSVTPGSSKSSTTLTISTTKSVSENVPTVPLRQRPVNAFWVQFQILGVVGIVLAKSKRRSRHALILPLLFLVALGVLFMPGCAGGTGIVSANPQSYTVTITGKYGSLQHSTQLTLTVE
jgi:hypothetical protein